MFGFSSPSILTILGTVFTTVSSILPRGGSHSQCSSVDFQISATAQNLVFSDPPDPNNVAEVMAFMAATTSTGVATNGTQSVSGTFTIHGVYCKPTKKVTKHADTLQLLVHGVTYNSSMWAGYGFGDKYNWHAYANDDGYHTLAIDRLGHGLSTRTADPLNAMQGPLHVEILHELIAAVRTDSAANALDKKFKKIAYVSKSRSAWLPPETVSATYQRPGWPLVWFSDRVASPPRASRRRGCGSPDGMEHLHQLHRSQLRLQVGAGSDP
jgi:hypothetical protein